MENLLTLDTYQAPKTSQKPRDVEIK